MQRSLLILPFLFLFTCAEAQIEMNEIIIKDRKMSDRKASELNGNIQILAQSDIRKLGVNSVTDLLHYLSGVQINARGVNDAQADVKINGGTFEQTLILINGHPLIDPQTGHHFMNLPISIQDIDHIEIISGPRAHSYGINGLAGSINIVTKAGNKNEISASVFAGSNFDKDTSNQKPYYNTGIHISASHHSKYSNQYLSVAGIKSTGYMYNTAVNNKKIFYSNELNLPREHKVNLNIGYVNNNFGANGFYAYPYDKNSIETVNTLWVTLNHEKRISTRWNLKSNFSVRKNEDDYIFIKSNPAYYHNKHNTLCFNMNTNAIYKYKAGEFAFGLNSNYQKINSTNLGKNERYNNGIFIENTFNWKKLNTTIGMYGNYNSIWGISVLPGLDMSYSINKNIRLYAGAGSANRIPTYTDLYYKGPSNIGNSLLVPEKAYGLDLGMRYESSQVQLNANMFYRRISNLIDWTKEKNTTIWQPSNFGLQYVQGLQLSSRVLFHETGHIYLKEVNAKYQYMNTGLVNTLENTDSKYVLDYFKHQLLGIVTISFYDKLQLTVTGRYQYRFNYHDYTLIDSRLAYIHNNYMVYADINNILNTSYLEANAQPMPNRWLTLGGSFKFKY